MFNITFKCQTISYMKYLYSVIFYLLIVISFSITLNFDQMDATQKPTILIFHKSKPSILIFPSNQTVTLKYPKRNQQTKIFQGETETQIKFGSLDELNKISPKSQQPKVKINVTEKKDYHTKNQAIHEKQSPITAKAKKAEIKQKAENEQQEEREQKAERAEKEQKAEKKLKAERAEKEQKAVKKQKAEREKQQQKAEREKQQQKAERAQKAERGKKIGKKLKAERAEKEQKAEREQKAEKAEQKQKAPKYPSLIGTFRLLHLKSFSRDQVLIKINATHVSYTICSDNSCTYSQDNGSIEIGLCELVPRNNCKPFEPLFYSDMYFLAQLKLVQSFKYEDGKYKFYDQQHQKRLQWQKED